MRLQLPVPVRIRMHMFTSHKGKRENISAKAKDLPPGGIEPSALGWLLSLRNGSNCAGTVID